MAKKAKGKTSTAKSKKRKVVKSKSAKKAKKQSASNKKGKQPKPKTLKKAAKKARAPRSKALRAGAESFFPPHKCERTPSGCLKFFPDKDGAYLLPPGGLAVDCAECQYWF